MAKILVVEDDPAMMRLATEILQAADHTVVQAPDGPEAIQLCRNQHVDLLLADMILPHLDVVTVLEQCRRKLPDLEAVLMSGYSATFLRERFTFPVGIVLLEKPFSPGVLISAVQQALTQ
jgi:two-component system cell cycle sensor histidine kinase/response regulator CckA